MSCMNKCGANGYGETGCNAVCPPDPINFPNCQGVQPVLKNSDCGPCCWDMSLCTTCPPTLCGGNIKLSFNIENNTKVPNIDNDTGAYLSIYNYSVQRFITRTLKFVTSYYDFVGGMINSTASDIPNNGVYRQDCSGESNSLRPSPAYPSSVRDRVFQSWQWVWDRLESTDSWDLFCEPDCLLQPVLTLLTLAGGEASSNFRNVLLKNSLSNITGGNCVNKASCGPFCDNTACAVTVGTQGCGKDYNDAQFFAWTKEVIGVIEIMEIILDSLDLSNDPMNAEQLLMKICDCYIKCACCDNGSNLPNNNCNLSVLSCFNRNGDPYNGRKITTADTSVAEIVRNTYGGCVSSLTSDEKYRPNDLNTSTGNGDGLEFGDVSETDNSDCCLPGSLPCAEDRFDGKLFIPNTKERLQAAIFVLDLIAFLLFDRDADKSQFNNVNALEKDNCYCPSWEGEDSSNNNFSDESWLRRRCKLGTGNGKCVVASGACAGYRTQDDFVPLTTMLVSMKHFITLLGIPHDEGYQTSVTDTYNSLLTKLHDIYLGDEELNFNVDCAAPLFCCTTLWTQTGRKLSAARGGKGCENPCASCNLAIPEYTVQCFARMKCSCIGPVCAQCPPKTNPCEPQRVNVQLVNGDC